jgi:hypothetical protein
LDCSSVDSTPLQVECGWAFSSVLTKTGDVFVFWPFKEEMLTRIAEKNAQFDRAGGKKVTVSGSDDVIPCVTWDLQMNPIRLPALPHLPELSDTGEAGDSDENIVLIQIAALDNNLVGLTNKGHVLKYSNLIDEASVVRGKWEYVRFSFWKFGPTNQFAINSCQTSARSKGCDTIQPSIPQKVRLWTTALIHLRRCKSRTSVLARLGSLNALFMLF